MLFIGLIDETSGSYKQEPYFKPYWMAVYAGL